MSGHPQPLEAAPFPPPLRGIHALFAEVIRHDVHRNMEVRHNTDVWAGDRILRHSQQDAINVAEAFTFLTELMGRKRD